MVIEIKARGTRRMSYPTGCSEDVGNCRPGRRWPPGVEGGPGSWPARKWDPSSSKCRTGFCQTPEKAGSRGSQQEGRPDSSSRAQGQLGLPGTDPATCVLTGLLRAGRPAVRERADTGAAGGAGGQPCAARLTQMDGPEELRGGSRSGRQQTASHL